MTMQVEKLGLVLEPRSDTRFFCPVRRQHVDWEAKDVFNPAAVHGGKVWLLYRAEDTVGKFAGTSRIGLAWSEDGVRFERHPEPVFFPESEGIEWEGGIEDPRVVRNPDGGFVMTYTAYDGELARLCVATSDDLWTWHRHGPAFRGTPYEGYWSKSGSIVSEVRDGTLTAARIRGRYWMYWGESDVFLATSEDLLEWKVVEQEDRAGRRKATLGTGTGLGPRSVFSVRPGRFDSLLVEPGPPAVLTSQGIAFLYNSANCGKTGDPARPHASYSTARMVLDSRDPASVIARATDPFLWAVEPYEVTGQIGNVTFSEGLVPWEGGWLLYYGTADSKIAVARLASLD